MSACSACCKTYWSSNRWRNINATFCYGTTFLLTLILLIVTSKNVSDKISWTNFEYHYEYLVGNQRVQDHHVVNVGLLTSKHCWTFDYFKVVNVCSDIPTPEAVDSNDLANAGRGVITANVFGMFFLIISFTILYLHTHLPTWAAKLKYPRIILFISNFLMLTMYIVSISTWFKLAQDSIASNSVTMYCDFCTQPGNMYAKPGNVTAGYAIALNIFIIVLAFFAKVFSFLRVQFPNHAEVEKTSTEGVGMMSETGRAISMQYQPPPIQISPSQAMGAYAAYNNMNSPPSQQKKGFFG